MARKYPKSLQSWLVPKLRRLSMYWPGKSIARERSRRVVNDGAFKNGRPRTKVMYECAICGPHVFHEKEDTQMDHINPVVDVKTGFTTWDNFLDSLFCEPDAFQTLCTEHHEHKTNEENKNRHYKKKSLTYSKNHAKIKRRYKFNKRKKKRGNRR